MEKLVKPNGAKRNGYENATDLNYVKNQVIPSKPDVYLVTKMQLYSVERHVKPWKQEKPYISATPQSAEHGIMLAYYNVTNNIKNYKWCGQ